MEASFHISYTVLKRNSGIFKNKGTSLWWNFALTQKTDLENFASAYWSSKRFIDFARQRWTLRAWWTGPSSVKSDNSSELRRSTAVVIHRWSLSSVCSTIPSRGSISDSWYLLSSRRIRVLTNFLVRTTAFKCVVLFLFVGNAFNVKKSCFERMELC